MTAIQISRNCNIQGTLGEQGNSYCRQVEYVECKERYSEVSSLKG